MIKLGKIRTILLALICGFSILNNAHADTIACQVKKLFASKNISALNEYEMNMDCKDCYKKPNDEKGKLRSVCETLQGMKADIDKATAAGKKSDAEVAAFVKKRDADSLAEAQGAASDAASDAASAKAAARAAECSSIRVNYQAYKDNLMESDSVMNKTSKLNEFNKSTSGCP